MAEAYPYTINGIYQRVAARLGDDDQSFDERLICTSVLDVLSTISIFRPDLFTKEVKVPLTANSCGQLLPEDCPRISGYVCVRSSNGDEIPVVLGNYEVNNRNRAFPSVRELCKDQPDVRLLNIMQFTIGVSIGNNRRFNISPVPPAGYDYSLVLECIELAEFSDNFDTELPSEVRPWVIPIVELVMYMLLTIDSADSAALARAQTHVNTFAQMSSLNLQGLDSVINTIANSGRVANA